MTKSAVSTVYYQMWNRRSHMQFFLEWDGTSKLERGTENASLLGFSEEALNSFCKDGSNKVCRCSKQNYEW